MGECKSPLKPFSFDVSVKAGKGRQDKVEIDCSSFLIIGGDKEVMAQIRDDVAVVRKPLLADFGSVEEYVAASQGWIFNRPPSQLKFALKVRSAPFQLAGNQLLGAPLFSGKCQFKYVGKECGTPLFRVALKLELNPTRFIRHQTKDEATGEGISAPRRSLFSFRKRSIKATVAGEWPLDESCADNWIPQTSTFRKLRSQRCWDRVMQRYLKGVFSEIDKEFRRAAEISLTPIRKPSVDRDGLSREYHLRRIETFWEFSSPDPIKTVRDIYPLLKSYTEREVKLRNYPLVRRGVDLKQQHNSPVISVLVQGGVELVIYAKTNRRIRFEVRHNLDVKKSLNHNHQVSVASRKALFPIFDRVREDAAKVVNDVIRHMRERSSYPADSFSPARFLLDFVRALNGLKGADSLLSMLIHNGRIVADKNIEEQVKALRKAGILEVILRNNKRANVLTANYRKAVALIGIRGFSLRGARDRNRTLDG